MEFTLHSIRSEALNMLLPPVINIDHFNAAR
jgi:hypothetical protein